MPSSPPARDPAAANPPADEAFLRRLLAASPDCVKVLDLTGRLLSMNPAGQAALEIDDLNPHVGTCWADWWHGPDHAVATAAVDEARAGGTGRFEAGAPTAKGTDKWWDVTVTAIPGSDGHPERLLSISRDVTARRAAADAAAERADRLRSIIESAKDYAVISIGIDGRIDGWSAGAADTFEWPETTAVGRMFDLIWTPEDLASGSPGRELATARADGAAPDNRWHLRADGTRVFVTGSTRPVRNAAGGLAGYVKVCRDETVARSAAEALRASTDRYQLLFDTIDDGFCVLHMIFDDAGRPVDYRFREINPAFSRLTGITAADALGGRTARELYPTLEEHWFQTYGRVATTGETARFENRAEAMGKWFEVTAFRLGGPGSVEVGLLFKDATARRLAEAERDRLAEDRRLALDAADLGWWRVDAATGEVTWDDRARAIFGVEDERMAMGLAIDRIQPDDRDRVRAAVSAATRPDDPQGYDIDYRVVHPGGAGRWVRARGQAHFAGEGRGRRYTSFVGTFEDVTAARAAADALRAERANLAAVVAQAPAFICTLGGPDHVFELVNDNYYRLVGRRDLVGRTVRDALPEVEGQGFFELLDGVYRTGEPAGGTEVPIVLGPDEAGGDRHRYVNFVYQALRGADGAVSGIFVHGVDVTSAVRARQDIAATERRRRLALDAAGLGAFNMDGATHVLSVDDRLRSIFGIADAGMNAAMAAIHPDDRLRVRAAIDAATRPDNPDPAYAVEHRVVHPDGGVRWVSAQGRALFAGTGADRRLASFDGTVADVTDRKVAEADRQALLEAERAARAEAELAGRMKDDFLATLSHELRTPLNAIVGWTGILRGPGVDADDYAEGLAVIDRNARAQTQIIEDILDMSRIVSGKLRLDVQRVDLAALVKAGADTVQPAADAKGVRLQVLLDPLVGPVTGDPGRLHQVFWNLLSNAVKFTPRGGKVQAMLERVNSHLEVSVADTGEGIDPAFLPHVFDRFRQQDSSTTRRHGGLGLGLAIVKQLVELHGGSVRVKSPGKGRGSTFVVALPLTVVHPEPDGPGAAHPREHPAAEVPLNAHRTACDQLAGVTVVAVDDEPDGVAVVRRLLCDCGAVVRTATSAAEALGLIRAEVPTVLVSDIGMPGQDGYELIRQVRALPPDAGGRVHALALTAYARAADRVRALEAGFQMHLAKPVEPTELVVTVAALARLAMP